MPEIDFSNIGELVTVISFAMTILGAVCTFLWKSYKKIRSIYDNINLISQELRPNGGQSMFDKINRIEATMTRGDFFQKMFLDTLDTPIFTTDDKGLITWANRSFLNILGRQISDVTGSGWETAIHQDDRDRVTKEWYESVEENRNFDLQYRCVRSDDEIILVRCKAFGGQKTGYFGILTKIRNFQKNKSPEVI